MFGKWNVKKNNKSQNHFHCVRVFFGCQRILFYVFKRYDSYGTLGNV